MKIDKKSLRNLIGSGKTKRAIDQLLLVTTKVDETLVGQVTNQKNRYSELKRQEINGTLSTDEVFRQRAIISTALLTIINDLPDVYSVELKKDESDTPTPTQAIVTPPPSTSPQHITHAPTPMSTIIPNNPNGQPLNALNYVLLFLLMLMIVIGVLTFFLTSGYGNDKTVQYFILIFLGLIVAAFTHGVMNSRSSIEGNTSKLIVRIGGPIVAFVLTVVGGYYFLAL